MFIPLGFVEKGPQKRYQASDPEFQAFLKFSRDKKKLSAARGGSSYFLADAAVIR